MKDFISQKRMIRSLYLSLILILFMSLSAYADDGELSVGCEINNSNDAEISFVSGFDETEEGLNVSEGAQFTVDGEACVNISGADLDQADDYFTVTNITGESVVININDHAYGETEVIEAATCAKAGSEQRICTNCGQVLTQEIPATDQHSWDNGRVDRKATQSTPGVKTLTCKTCGLTKEQPIAKAAAPTGTVVIRNTIANSAKKTNDVIWDKSNVKGATGYEINWKARGADKWASRKVGNTVRGTTSGLTIGGLYEIRVRPYKAATATTAETYGAWSGTVYRYFHTTETIRLTSKTRGSFTMSWKKNPAATGYQVMYSKNSNGAGAANNIRPVGASSNSYTQTGLNPGSTYYVQVREIRKIGNINYIGNISCPVAVKVRAVNPVTPSAAASASGSSSGGGGIVYWTPLGKVYHLSRNCSTLARSKRVYSGTRAQSGKSRACKVCG